METYKHPSKTRGVILALGAESAGNFSVYKNGIIYFSEDFGDLLKDANFNKYQHALNEFLKKNQIKPDIILTDLHPLYKTTILGQKLAKKYTSEHVQIQHHLAHIFSSFGEYAISNFQFPISKKNQNSKFKIQNSFFGIAMDGTGFGTDGKIWGGEIFKLQTTSHKLQNARIGHLENQPLIGGDLAIQEPARMLISILSKFLSKEEVYKYTKKYYSKNKFEVLYSQLQQNFNCIETSSTGRILDAASILLGFCDNKRNYKHEPIDLLEKNSTKPYTDLRPKLQITNYKTQTNSKSQIQNPKFILLTTPLFEYLVKNLNRDKNLPADEAGRLAATAQLYVAKGLYEIIKRHHVDIKCPPLAAPLGHLMSNQDIFLAGGIANNKIISSFLESKGAYRNKTIPRGDAGLSLGQIFYSLLADPRN